MNNFTFTNPTKVIFGKDQELTVGKEVKQYTNKVLLHYGSGSVIKSGLLDRIKKSLEAEDIEYYELGNVQPNPRLELVYRGIDLCKEKGIEFILAVGGGSVIDSAKAIGMGCLCDFDVWDFFMGKATPEAMLPVGVVLTIPAAGSETSTSTVITNSETGYKRGTGGEMLRPKFAIMNPMLTYTLPDYQTACGGADMLAHVMERYFTNTTDVEFTDRLCEATMKSIIHNIPLALRNNQDYAARSEIMWAGSIAHNGLLDTGRIGDWASHGIEHELSAWYDIAHGAGLAIIFPAWMKYVYKHDIPRFVKFANRVFDVEINVFNQEETVLKGIECLKNFFSSIGLPVSFADAQLPLDDIDDMASRAAERSIGRFVELNKEDIKNIYHLDTK